jgi:N-methylhydantoinase A
VENGEDLSTYTMIAFGGAAPLHAGRLCEKLGVARCLIPQGAGVGSAIGFLRAPFSFESNRTHFMPHAGFDPQAVRDLFADMVAEATRFVRTCAPDAPIKADFKVYMRYKGQGWEIPVPLTPDQAEQADPAVFLARFEQEYTTLFGRTVAGMAVEITVWSVNATTAPAAVDALPPVTAQAPPAPSGHRALFDAALGRAQDAGIYGRASLAHGATLQGPALITEEETTTVLPLSRQARILGDGSIDITVQGV